MNNKRKFKYLGIVLLLAFVLWMPGKQAEAASKPAKITSAKAISKEEVVIRAKVKKKVAGGNKYYLVKVNGFNNKPVSVLAQSKKQKKLVFRLGTEDKVNVISKFGIAVKKGSKYKLISNTCYLKNPEKTAAHTEAYQLPATKKGIHGQTDMSLTAKHTLTTLNLNELIGDARTGEPYVYNGKTFYFTRARQETVKKYVAQGICVTMVVHMTWEDKNKNLIYPSGRQKGDYWYMVNTANNETREQLEAAFCYLAEKFSTEDCKVSNWVVGNEVNSQHHWNHVGNLNLSTYVKAYVQEFQMMSSAVRTGWSNARVFTPLDNAWNIPVSNVGWNGKTFLTAFAKALKKENSRTKWNLAYHAYSFPLTAAPYKKQQYVTNSPNSYYITPKNIEQLTKYIKSKYGASTRIILSEQGYTSTLGQKEQAASILYTYYKGEFNPMIDAVIFRCEKDNTIEAGHGYSFGLSDANGKHRLAYDVFQKMDTREAPKYTKKYLQTMGASSWKALIPGYKESRFE